MSNRSYYEILGVRRGADSEEIRDAWRRAARRLHPDLNREDPQSEERFQEAAEAWATLRDPVLRRRYDIGGIAPRGSRHAETDVSLGTVLRRAASAANRSLRARRGDDVEVQVSLEVEEAMEGTSRVFRLPRARNPGADVPDVEWRKLAFDLPAGVLPGRLLRWRGEGAPGTFGAEPGDLLVRISHRAHAWLGVVDGVLEATLALRLGEMVGGGRHAIPVASGRSVGVDVPPGSTPGDVILVPQEGWPSGGGERGPLTVRLELDVPRGPFGPEAVEALRRFEELLDEADRAPSRLQMAGGPDGEG